jgi:hypothetical protein
MDGVPEDNPFRTSTPSAAAAAPAPAAAAAPAPGRPGAKAPRRGSGRSAGRGSAGGAAKLPPGLHDEYDGGDIRDAEAAGGGARPAAPAAAAPPPRRGGGGGGCRACATRACGCAARVAKSRAGSLTVLLSASVSSLCLFGLTAALLETPAPFSQHAINWRAPLSFFVAAMAAAAVANVCLRQHRSLAAMAIGLVVSGLLFFYVLIVDGPQADARMRACDALPAAARAANPGCATGLYSAVVVLDFVHIPWLVFAGAVAWLHRRTLAAAPLTAAPRGGGGGGGGEEESAGGAAAFRAAAGEEEAPQVNVFKTTR